LVHCETGSVVSPFAGDSNCSSLSYQ